MLPLPSPRVSHGFPIRHSHCCCLHRHTLPFVPHSGLLHTACVFNFLTSRVLADYGPPPIAAARPLICHRAPYINRLPLMLLRGREPGPKSLMGPCTASHCCCLHRHTGLCHGATFRSPHTAGVVKIF
ncbi:unnamed protein product [Staurois parvus]|uniref:Uncharacterized protein n=1 Tax=Staurois parvus TaxID=386267 RepID=A0ABN9FBF3_9NEOB|nr:unnamed protein product [Staurois parvus]